MTRGPRILPLLRAGTQRLRRRAGAVGGSLHTTGHGTPS